MVRATGEIPVCHRFESDTASLNFFVKGEPFDWVAIEKPDGTIKPVIEFIE